MTRKEFIRELDNNLRDISLDERIEAVRYYEEIFEGAEENGDTESYTAQNLGSPSEIAREIIRQSGFVALQSESAYNQEQKQHNNIPNKDAKKTTKEKLNNTAIIILICLFPIWSGILACMFGVVACIWGAVFGIITALGAIIFSLGVVSAALLGFGFTVLFNTLMTGLIVIGAGFTVGAVFLALLQPICHAIKCICVGLWKGTVYLCKETAGLFEAVFTRRAEAYE